MAIGWLSVLQMVPWGDVISNAPKVAEGAKKLWKSVGKKPPSTQAAADAALAELHEQMLASSELIKALAEQNAQLVQRVEAHRIRVRWLSVATLVLAIVAISSLVLTLSH